MDADSLEGDSRHAAEYTQCVKNVATADDDVTTKETTVATTTVEFIAAEETRAD